MFSLGENIDIKIAHPTGKLRLYHLMRLNTDRKCELDGISYTLKTKRWFQYFCGDSDVTRFATYGIEKNGSKILSTS